MEAAVVAEPADDPVDEHPVAAAASTTRPARAVRPVRLTVAPRGA